jgi:hypothetical protein
MLGLRISKNHNTEWGDRSRPIAQDLSFYLSVATGYLPVSHTALSAPRHLAGCLTRLHQGQP